MIYLMLIDTETDKTKFGILYEEYRRLMRKVAFDILKDYGETEDVLHESFLKVAKNMKNVGDPYSKETKNYLVVITKNTAIDLYRKKKRIFENEMCVEELKDYQVPRSYIKTDIDAEHLILDVLKNLPDIYKNVLLLKYVNHYENKEIARILNIKEGNVRQRLLRGKQMIEKAVNELKEEHDDLDFS